MGRQIGNTHKAPNKVALVDNYRKEIGDFNRRASINAMKEENKRTEPEIERSKRQSNPTRSIVIGLLWLLLTVVTLLYVFKKMQRRKMEQEM